jgi:murein DD-endopeptidase MepM/ murein hydrolase activator NlpD
MRAARISFFTKLFALAALIFALVCLVLIAAPISGASSMSHSSASVVPTAFADSSHVPCVGVGDFPVRLADGTISRTVLEEFDAPARNWLPGHRGIDIAAPPGSRIVAPAGGTITFSGSVGGKNSVSLTLSNGVVLSFEPAISSFPKGTSIEKGATLALVKGHSDHCDSRCVHWGARRSGRYVDPRAALMPVRIILKPTNSP